MSRRRRPWRCRLGIHGPWELVPYTITSIGGWYLRCPRCHAAKWVGDEPRRGWS